MPISDIPEETSRLAEIELAETPIAISGAGDVKYSRSFALPEAALAIFGGQVQLAVASGTPHVKMELQGGNVKLTAAQEGLANANYVVPEGREPIISDIDDADVHIFDNVPATTRYARWKFTGLDNCAACSVITCFNRIVKAVQV